VTVSPSDTEAAPADTSDPLAEFAAAVAAAVDGEGTAAFGTAKVRVPAERWAESVAKVRDEFHLIFFSFLSAIDWSNEVAVGDPLQAETEERYEVLCTLADLSHGRRVTLSSDISKDDPHIGSIIEVFPGAGWHEREAHEMFGIVFDGNPDLSPLYLPDGFQGHPLRKSFPLLAREVKPWPGKVDVEGLPGGDDDGPSEENPEA
jgi:NADH-quinone oxidoreductase subunit C